MTVKVYGPFPLIKSIEMYMYMNILTFSNPESIYIYISLSQLAFCLYLYQTFVGLTGILLAITVIDEALQMEKNLMIYVTCVDSDSANTSTQSDHVESRPA